MAGLSSSGASVNSLLVCCPSSYAWDLLPVSVTLACSYDSEEITQGNSQETHFLQQIPPSYGLGVLTTSRSLLQVVTVVWVYIQLLFPSELSPQHLFQCVGGPSSPFAYLTRPCNINKIWTLPWNNLKDLCYFIMQNNLFPFSLCFSHPITLEPSLSDRVILSKRMILSPQGEICTCPECRSCFLKK